MSVDPSPLDAALDELAAGPAREPLPHQTCGITAIMSALPGETAARIARLIDETPISAARIATKLREHGIEVAPYTIQRHRKRKTGAGCKCP